MYIVPRALLIMGTRLLNLVSKILMKSQGPSFSVQGHLNVPSRHHNSTSEFVQMNHHSGVCCIQSLTLSEIN